MIYPPTDSIFYKLNPTPENIGGYTNKINPKLSDKEIQAIYDSFTIENEDFIIQNHTLNGIVRDIRYKDLAR